MRKTDEFRLVPPRASAVVLAVFVLAAASPQAMAQAPIKLNIWELQMGTPFVDLPPQYLDPHCGTNGGPQSRRLDGREDFALCFPDRATGLYEIWITEDDEQEYVARAYRSQLFEPGPVAANVLYGHKTIYSILVDADGLVQGYRAFTDPREREEVRYTAVQVGDAIRGFYGYGNFECVNLPPEPGETDYEGRLVKEVCVAVVDNRHITIERRLLRKPGQTAIDPVTQTATVNYFESSTRLEVLNVALVPEQ